MKQPAILVIDIGTTLVKVGLFDFRCRLIDRTSSRHCEPGHGDLFNAEGCWQVVAAWLDLGPNVDPKPEWMAPLEKRYRLFSEATAEMLTESTRAELKAKPDGVQ